MGDFPCRDGAWGAEHLIQHRLSLESKYAIVGRLLAERSGSLLDIGARDRVLRGYLEPGRQSYSSADVAPGLDYTVDLEETLAFGDRSFDIVVALDVLEHVDAIHLAFFELARIAGRDLVIALPTLSSWPRRWSFLRSGHLGTRKYELPVDPCADRHRWLTVYDEVDRFVRANAEKAGFTCVAWIEQLERLPRPLNVLWGHMQPLGLFRRGRFTQRSIYLLTRIDR